MECALVLAGREPATAALHMALSVCKVTVLATAVDAWKFPEKSLQNTVHTESPGVVLHPWAFMGKFWFLSCEFRAADAGDVAGDSISFARK